MQKNIGNLDAAIRILLAIVLGYLFYENYISNVLGIFLLVVSGALIFTGFAGWCPVYGIFRIRTCKENNSRNED